MKVMLPSLSLTPASLLTLLQSLEVVGVSTASSKLEGLASPSLHVEEVPGEDPIARSNFGRERTSRLHALERVEKASLIGFARFAGSGVRALHNGRAVCPHTLDILQRALLVLRASSVVQGAVWLAERLSRWWEELAA